MTTVAGTENNMQNHMSEPGRAREQLLRADLFFKKDKRVLFSFFRTHQQKITIIGCFKKLWGLSETRSKKIQKILGKSSRLLLRLATHYTVNNI